MSSIKEEDVGIRKLHLNNKGNSEVCTIFISNFKRYKLFGGKQIQYDSNTIDTSNDFDKNSDTNLKTIHMKNLNQLVVTHFNINSLRNKFEHLADQVK